MLSAKGEAASGPRRSMLVGQAHETQERAAVWPPEVLFLAQKIASGSVLCRRNATGHAGEADGRAGMLFPVGDELVDVCTHALACVRVMIDIIPWSVWLRPTYGVVKRKRAQHDLISLEERLRTCGSKLAAVAEAEDAARIGISCATARPILSSDGSSITCLYPSLLWRRGVEPTDAWWVARVISDGILASGLTVDIAGPPAGARKRGARRVGASVYTPPQIPASVQISRRKPNPAQDDSCTGSEPVRASGWREHALWVGGGGSGTLRAALAGADEEIRSLCETVFRIVAVLVLGDYAMRNSFGGAEYWHKIEEVSKHTGAWSAPARQSCELACDLGKYPSTSNAWGTAMKSHGLDLLRAAAEAGEKINVSDMSVPGSIAELAMREREMLTARGMRSVDGTGLCDFCYGF